MSSIFKSSLGITVVTVIGMLFGLLKQIVIAKYYGTSSEYDNLLIALAIPSILGGISITFFSSTLIPNLTPIKDDIKHLSEIVSFLVVRIFLAIVIGCAVAISMSRPYLSHYTPFVGDRLSLTVELAIYAWIITGIEILNYFLTSLFHLKKRFLFPAVIHLMVPVGIISGVYLWHNSTGIKAIMIGWLLAVITIFFFLLPVLKDYGVVFVHTKVLRRDKYNIKFLNVSLAVLIGGLPFTVLPAIDGFWASRLSEGSMSYIGYCTQITIAIDSVVKNGVYFVLLPYLSENFSYGQEEIFWHRIRTVLFFLYTVMIPAVVFFSYFGHYLVGFLYQRGRFTEISLKHVAGLLPFYLCGGLLAMVPVTILQRAYYARLLYRPFANIALVMIIVYFTFSGFLSQFWGVYGIGMAYNLYWFCFLLLTTISLRPTLFDKAMFALIFKLLVVSIVSIISVHILPHEVKPIMKVLIGLMILILFAYLLKIHKGVKIKM